MVVFAVNEVLLVSPYLRTPQGCSEKRLRSQQPLYRRSVPNRDACAVHGNSVGPFELLEHSAHRLPRGSEVLGNLLMGQRQPVSAFRILREKEFRELFHWRDGGFRWSGLRPPHLGAVRLTVPLREGMPHRVHAAEPP